MTNLVETLDAHKPALAAKTYPEIDVTTMAALRSMRAGSGRVWKARLRRLWERGEAGPTLHRLRNTHGPAWLAGFRFPED